MRVDLTIDVKNKEVIIYSSVTVDELNEIVEEFGFLKKGYQIVIRPKSYNPFGNALQPCSDNGTAYHVRNNITIMSNV